MFSWGALGQAIQFVWARGRSWTLLSVLFAIVLGILPTTAIWVTKELLNVVATLLFEQSEDYALALWLLSLQFALAMLASILSHVQEYLNRKMEVRLDRDLQHAVAQKVSSVPLAYLDLPHFYHHVVRAGSGQGARFLSPLQHVLNMSQQIISIVSFILLLLTIHWSLAVISLVSAIPIFIVQSKYGRQKFWLNYHQTPLAREASYTAQLMQDREIAKEIRLFRLGNLLLERWSALFLKNATAALQLLRRTQTASVFLDGLTALLYVGAAGIMIGLVSRSAIKMGDFVAIGQAVQGTQAAMNQMASIVARLYEESMYLQDFFAFLNYEDPKLQQTNGTRPFPVPLRKGIAVENISFRYPNTSRDILRDVSFTIKPGEKVAIVGANGSGKTTLVKCLMGLYQIDQGQIRFEDVTLQEMDKEDLYKHTTVIFQDFARYAFSVRDNLVFGQVEQAADEERMLRVARETGVHEFVEGFQNGYDTYLGRFLYDGEDLSGGQWQKVALARALFGQGELLILDEPTAALDPYAELEVFQQFDRLTQGRTAIFISHRMAAARMADQILVMKEGRLVERGTHEELMRRGGEYSQMFSEQAKWYA